MNYIVQVAVEADNGKAAGNKIPDEVGTVIAVNPRPQAPQVQIAGSQFSRTTTVPTPSTTGQT